MKLTLDLPGMIRVVPTTDYKGNPVTVLLIGDMEVLYASGHAPESLSPESWEDVFRQALSRKLADLLLPAVSSPPEDPGPWSRESPTGRETWGHDGTDYDVRLTQER